MNIIEQLKKIGMSHKQCIVSKYYPYIFVNKGLYSLNDFGSEEEIERAIDCGTNEDLFLAIAALRDDTDKNQWFVDYSTGVNGGSWYLSDLDNIHDCFQSTKECHKATVEELIEHFKDK